VRIKEEGYRRKDSGGRIQEGWPKERIQEGEYRREET
jgi:hypothetical protein